MTCFVQWGKLQSCLIIFVQIIWLCLVKVQLSKILVFPAHLESESEVTQSCPILCDSMDCSLPGTSVHKISQARILVCVAISFSRRSFQPRDRTWVLPHCRQMLYCLSHQGSPRHTQNQTTSNTRHNHMDTYSTRHTDPNQPHISRWIYPNE